MIKKIIVEALKEVLDIKEGKLAIMGDIEDAKAALINSEKELSNAKIRLEEVKAKHVREDDEIKHKVQMVKEKNDIALSKKEQVIIADYQRKELELMQDHQKAINKLMEGNMKEMKSMYDKISDTLAGAVNVEIKKGS